MVWSRSPVRLGTRWPRHGPQRLRGYRRRWGVCARGSACWWPRCPRQTCRRAVRQQIGSLKMRARPAWRTASGEAGQLDSQAALG